MAGDEAGRLRAGLAQKSWATVTVAKVPDTLLKTIVGGRGSEPIVVDPVYGRVAAALERKGQLILYGPPGTGKTYQARRFAVWWLMKQVELAEAFEHLAVAENPAAHHRQVVLFAPGETRSFSFLLNMNQLFERFVTRVVEQVLPAARYRVTSQLSFRSVVWNVSSQRPYTNIIPDVVVERRGASDCRVAIDAKYKLYDERGFDLSILSGGSARGRSGVAASQPAACRSLAASRVGSRAIAAPFSRSASRSS